MLHTTRGCRAGLLVISLASAPTVFSEPTNVSGPALDRLTKVARLWGDVRYLHPYVVSHDVDWDRAFVDAVPALLAARDVEGYRHAVEGMLTPLADPATRVTPVPAPAAEGPPSPGEPPALFHWADREGEVLVVELARTLEARGYSAIRGLIGELGPVLANAKAVVVDLRPLAPAGPEAEILWFVDDALEQLAPLLTARACVAPRRRMLLHSGYPPQSGGSSGGYYSSWVVPLPRQYGPSPQARPPARAVFLLPGQATLPDLVLAQQAAGTGFLVTQGALAPDAGTWTHPVDLGEGLRVQMRVSEDLTGAPSADVEVEGADRSAALAAAIAIARGERPVRASAMTPAPSAAEGSWKPDATYPEMVEPSLPYRLLAVVRLWNVIRLFYPYLELIGDWNAVLPEFLARMQEAQSARQYALAMREMAMRITDSHTSIRGHAGLEAPYGEGQIGSLPMVLRRVEGQPVVVARSEEAGKAGIQVGDVLRDIDSRNVDERASALAVFSTASTPAGLANKQLAELLKGPVASPARLRLLGSDDREKEVVLRRQPQGYWPERGGAVFRLISPRVGYADLARLEVNQVEEMFRLFRGTTAIVFDMRGYPRGTAWAIAPRINTKGVRYAARFRRAQVSALSTEEAEAAFSFSQPLPEPSGVEVYRGRTLMLIDDRAISQSEHTGLFFEVANGTAFVGSPSAGANGDVTSTTVPGGITIGFTGHDVRHADGRQLQRVGLQPDVPVEPTLAGLRAGRDEVLDRALRYLEDGR